MASMVSVLCGDEMWQTLILLDDLSLSEKFSHIFKLCVKSKSLPW